jgi:hypothetical protein
MSYSKRNLLETRQTSGMSPSTMIVLCLLSTTLLVSGYVAQPCHLCRLDGVHTRLYMVLTPPRQTASSSSVDAQTNNNNDDDRTDDKTVRQSEPNGRRIKYQRKRIPKTEQEIKSLRDLRQAKFDQLVKSGRPSVWSLDSLFPEPVWDEATIHRDLYEVRERDDPQQRKSAAITPLSPQTKTSSFASSLLSSMSNTKNGVGVPNGSVNNGGKASLMRIWRADSRSVNGRKTVVSPSSASTEASALQDSRSNTTNATQVRVDRDLSRLVRDRLFGYRRTVMILRSWGTGQSSFVTV